MTYFYVLTLLFMKKFWRYDLIFEIMKFDFSFEPLYSSKFVFVFGKKLKNRWCHWFELWFILNSLFARIIHSFVQKSHKSHVKNDNNIIYIICENKRTNTLKQTRRFPQLDSIFKSSVLCAKSRYYLLSGVVTILVFEQQQSFRHGHKGGDCGWREQ